MVRFFEKLWTLTGPPVATASTSRRTSGDPFVRFRVEGF